ncbi:hypothetical protein BHM03_00030428 [Ensete ventricosum]|nr:hypothetical protein BHM03_00030428 [Ensete ventricosum]
MERNREARRGTTAASTATNGSGGGGGGLSRRRQRNSSGFRDSPGSEFTVSLPSLSWAKKDRDRDRSSRRKRRRGERTLHGSNRDEGDQSSENSLDEDEEDDDDDLFKPVTGAKHRPPKISKSTSFGQDEIEIEVAEWISTAPKRKRPRPVRFDEESSMSPVGLHNLSSISLSSIAKIDPEHQIKAEASSPRSEKNNASPAIIQGGGSADVLVSQAGFSDVQESAKTEKKDLHPSSGGSDARDGVENKEELVSPSKDST